MIRPNSKAIYLQIADRICDDILAGELRVDDRLPSVREYAALVQVNPNTMMRTYDHLSQQEIIFNRRGIGFFVAPGAPERVREARTRDLMQDELLPLFNRLRLLGISPETLRRQYESYLNSSQSL